ncbi:MAG TPA: GEVED domain-containing protein, partial [Cytophagales bacterium]
GLLNAQRAAQVIAGHGQGHLLIERTLAQGEAYAVPVVASGREPLVVTISWSDPPGPALAPSTATLNSRSPRLVNDLDVRLEDAAGTYLPWTLNPNAPGSPAAGGDNTRDNVEQVVVANPVPGRVYTIRTVHKGALQGGRQAFALLASGTGGASFCTSAGRASTGLRIAQVTLGTISNASGTNCTPYADYTHLSANAAPGQSLPLAVYLSGCGSTPGGFVQVFVDWDGDFGFTSPGELAAASGAIAGAGTYTTRLSIPASVVPGTALRMRVVVSRTAGVAPCGDYAEGETEEYTLRVVRPEWDAQPAALDFPEADLCPQPAVPVVVSLRNVGAGPLADVPVQVVIEGESAPAQTLRGVLRGVLAPFAEGKVALEGTFAARPGERYTFRVTVQAPGDANRANDTLSFRRTAGPPGTAPGVTATACAADSVQLQATGPGVTYWYDAPAGGSLLGVGNRVRTAVRTPGLTYYAAANELTGRVGPVRKSFAAEGGYGQFTPAVRVTTQVPLVIERARLYVGSGGSVTFTVETLSGIPVASRTIDVTPTRSPAGPGALPNDPADTGRVYLLQLPVPRPGNYLVSVSYGSGATLFRNNSGVAGYPFTLPGVLAISGNTASTDSENFYYYFYDVEVKAYGCPGPRVGVAANQVDAPAPTAVLTAGGTVCEGDTAQLTVQLTGTPPWNLTYTDGTDTTEVTGITASPWRLLTTRAGTYAITALADARSCPVYRSAGPATVTLRPRPPATIRVEGYLLTASEGAGYEWFLNGVPMSPGNVRQLEVWQDGRYRVAVTYANGCKSLSEEVVVDLAAIPGTGEPRVKLWPNPTDGLIYLKGMPLLPPLSRVRLLNLLGQTLANWEYADPARRRSTSLSIGAFGRGTYLLVVEAEGRSFVFKVSKQ